ncbi:MAG: SRPBCC domain-containing protein [Chloroflexota bacterium]
MNNSVNGKASTVKETFSRETSVSIKINAPATVVWGLLTNASDMARWNSTSVSLEGNIALGKTVKLVSTLDESRTFGLTVKEFEPQKRLVWGDRQGNRTYTITPEGDGVIFSMREKIGGLLFPLFSRFIPPFDESFEQYAADLKKEAEAQAN